MRETNDHRIAQLGLGDGILVVYGTLALVVLWSLVEDIQYWREDNK